MAASEGVAPRIWSLFARRGPGLYLLGLFAAGVGSCFSTLTDHLGFELAELVALFAGLFGPCVGVAAARSELDRSAAGERTSASAALTAALFAAIVALCVPLVLVLLDGVRRPACDRVQGLILFAALPLPSALLAAALGAACTFASPRRFPAPVAPVFTAPPATDLNPPSHGPQGFAFHHLGGMFPGPIYDEEIAATPALWAFRGATLLYTAGCAGLALFFGALRLGGEGRFGRCRRGALLALLALSGAASLSFQSERLHWKASTAGVGQALGGVVETAHLVLHLPREKPEAERRLLALDAEVSLREVREFFGLSDRPGGPKIEVWLYRSAAEKRRLVGAAETSFTKPWLRQIHTNDAPSPHPVLRHELAHAVAAEFARGPFAVASRVLGLLPDMALVEGVAVAADWPGGEATLHEEAAAMRRLGKSPSVVELFGRGAFYAEAGPRAYTVTGSFLRFVWQEKGAQRLRSAYGSSRGIAEIGPPEALADQHGRFLDSLQVSAPVLALSALRFSRPSIVHRTCPHEVAKLQGRAARAARSGALELAGDLWSRSASLEPCEPAPLLQLHRVLVSAVARGDSAAAEKAHAAEARALSLARLSAPQKAQLLVQAGDLAWLQGDSAGAEARYAEAAAVPQPQAATRALQARRYALADPVRWPASRRLLVLADAGPQTLLHLGELDLSRPREGFAPYLIARQLLNLGDFSEAARFARRALERELPPGGLFEREALRMLGEASFRSADAASARAAFQQLARSAPPGEALEARRWLDLVEALPATGR